VSADTDKTRLTVERSLGSVDVAGRVVAGKYRLEAIVGVGAMAVVVRARHELLGRSVALKFLQPAAREHANTVERMLREARVVAKLQSKHVVRVLDVDILENGAPFIVMELLDGRHLGELLERRGALGVTDAVDYVLETLDAVAEAHSHGIVHRDLKLANLFRARRSDGKWTIKVLDFGLSKASSWGVPLGTSSLTDSLDVLGSPLYMSPEQFRAAKQVDERADIWSMGVILYKLLTNESPFQGETMGQLFASVQNSEPPSVRSLRPEVPAGLEQVIDRCLRKEPEDRYASASDLARALVPYGSGGGTTWRKHAPLVRGMGIIGLVSGGLAALVVARACRSPAPVALPEPATSLIARMDANVSSAAPVPSPPPVVSSAPPAKAVDRPARSRAPKVAPERDIFERE
jgi:serine/threonine protein kinase